MPYDFRQARRGGHHLSIISNPIRSIYVHSRLVFFAAVFVLSAAARQIDPSAYSSLHYRYLGPPGNRAIAVTGIPGDPSTYYVGAASGGIWKTTDGGVHWKAIFDDQPAASIGALALASSDPNIVWAGTGETFIRSHISMGWAIFKSENAGKTWTSMGLEKTGRIGRIVVDPRNPNIVLAAALGHSYGPQQERGIYRTSDGGKTWSRVLFVDENTGAADIVMDPNHPDILFATMWQIEVHTWGRVSGGPGSGIWKSTDGGVTWNRLAGHGLPERPFGKAGLAMTKADSSRVYALIETGRGIPWNGSPGFDQGINTAGVGLDRKSTRLNSSHQIISYSVFCLKKKKT